jgi:hypothetical protein
MPDIETLFMALFFLALFTASGPAAFVAELLAAACARAGIAQVGKKASQGVETAARRTPRPRPLPGS